MITGSEGFSISKIGLHFKILWYVILKPNLKYFLILKLELLLFYWNFISFTVCPDFLSRNVNQRLENLFFCRCCFMAAGLLSPYFVRFLVTGKTALRQKDFSLFITNMFAGCLNPLVHWTDTAFHICVWWKSWMMNFAFRSWPISSMLSFFMVQASNTAWKLNETMD